MYAVLGVGLMAAAVLLGAWTYGQFQRPQPKSWTESEFAAVSLTLTVTCLIAFALASLGNFLFTLDAETRWLEALAVAAGAGLLCWFLVPRLMAPARRGAIPLSAAQPLSPGAPGAPANDPHPRSPVRTGRPAGKSGKRRAA